MDLIRRAAKRLIPDEYRYQRMYRRVYGRLCNFRRPRLFSEKIFSRMRYPHPTFSKVADKVAVREYVEDVVGEKFLVPVYKVEESSSLGMFRDLPDSFVMKSNNGCGQVYVVRSKKSENLNLLKDMAESWLKIDYSKKAGERHYNGIAAKLLFEKALLSEGAPPDDYKVHFFRPSSTRSKPYVFIQHVKERVSGEATQSIHFPDWSLAPFGRKGVPKHEPSKHRPEQLDLMLEIAEKLSVGFGYLRVDFYIYKSRVYVGELTLTPGAGVGLWEPAEWDLFLGEKFGWPDQPSLNTQLY